MLSHGTRFGGKYQLCYKIGKGAYGEIYTGNAIAATDRRRPRDYQEGGHENSATRRFTLA